MNHFKIKVKQFLPPYLIILFSLLIIYTFLHWLLLDKINGLKVNEDVTDFFIPFGLPWIPLIIWLRPSLKKLRYETAGRKDPVMGIILFSGFAIGAVLCIAQSYMVTETGKLTPLDKISDIHDQPAAKYYTVKKYYLSKSLAHIFTFYSYSGKSHQYFDMDVCIAVPIFDQLFPDTTNIAKLESKVIQHGLVIINGKLNNINFLKRIPADSITAMRYINPSLTMPQYGEAGKYGALLVVTRGYKLKNAPEPVKIHPPAWLAVRFSKSINNSRTPGVNQKLLDDYIEKSYQAFFKKDYSGFTYLNRIDNKDFSKYLEVIQHRSDVDAQAPTILYPVYDSYADRNGDDLLALCGVGVGGLLFVLVFVCFCKANPDVNLL